MKLGYFEFALADCNDALALIRDPVPQAEVAFMKVRLLSRKTYCLYKLGRYLEAFNANNEILKYMTKEPTIHNDLKEIALLAGDKLKLLPQQSQEKPKDEKKTDDQLPEGLEIVNLDENGNEIKNKSVE